MHLSLLVSRREINWSEVSYPVGTQFNGVRVTIGLFAKVGVGYAASKSVAVFDDHEVVDRRVGQSLLYTREYRVRLHRRKGVPYSCSNTGHSTSARNALVYIHLNEMRYASTHRIATVVLVHFASSLGLAVAAAQVCTTSAAAHSDFLTNIAASLERIKVQYPLSRATPPAYKKLRSFP